MSGGLVCSIDGVAIAWANTGKWVHLDMVPSGADPDHAIDPVHPSLFRFKREQDIGVREASIDLLRHHSTYHPESDCEWAIALGEALRR